MQENQMVSQKSESYRISIAGTDLNFRDLKLDDPKPTGKQVAEAAGGRPADEYIVLQWLKDNDLEELDFEETVDLREPGNERFIVAKSDRTFRFEIDGHKYEWPEANISREILLKLAGQDVAKFSIWLEQRGADKEILAGQPADLAEKGTERFYTVMKHTTEGSA